MRLMKRFLVSRLKSIKIIYKCLVWFINGEKNDLFFTKQLPTFEEVDFNRFKASNPYFYNCV